MSVIGARCADCAHWESKDGLCGTCEEITEALRLTPLMVHGLAPCRTAASGHCTRFDPSGEAMEAAADEAAHAADLRRGAGIDYPGSLSRAGSGRAA